MGYSGYRESVIDEVLHLFCTQCLDTLPHWMFHKSNYTKADGTISFRSACKICHSEQNKEVRKSKNHEKA